MGPEHLIWSEQRSQPLANPFGESEVLSGEVSCRGHRDRKSGKSRVGVPCTHPPQWPAQTTLGPVPVLQCLRFLPGLGIRACPEVLPVLGRTVIVTGVCVVPQIPEAWG